MPPLHGDLAGRLNRVTAGVRVNRLQGFNRCPARIFRGIDLACMASSAKTAGTPTSRGATPSLRPPEIIKAPRRTIFGRFSVNTIYTSDVEQNNLTIRTFLRRFTRLSLGVSKKLEIRAAGVAPHVAHCNFCRRLSTLRMAMAAGVTDTLWNLEQLLKRIQG